MELLSLLGRAALVFGLLAVTLWLVRRTDGGRRLQRVAGPLEVVSTARLGKGASLALVRIGATTYALGVTEHAVNLLTETDLPAPTAPVAAPPAQPDGTARAGSSALAGAAGPVAAQPGTNGRSAFAAALQEQTTLLLRRGAAAARGARREAHRDDPADAPRSLDLRSTDPRSTDPRNTDLPSTSMRSTDLSSAEPASTDLSSAELAGTGLARTDQASTDQASTEPRSIDLRSAEVRSTGVRSTGVRSTGQLGRGVRSTDAGSADQTGTDATSADDSGTYDLRTGSTRRQNVPTIPSTVADGSAASTPRSDPALAPRTDAPTEPALEHPCPPSRPTRRTPVAPRGRVGS